MGLKRPWKIIFCWAAAEILNYPSQIFELPLLEHDEYSRTPQGMCLNTLLSKNKNTIRKLLLIFGLNCFEETMGKALFSFFFYIWKTYFPSFLFLRLKNLYLFNVFSQFYFLAFWSLFCSLLESVQLVRILLQLCCSKPERSIFQCQEE